MTERIQVLSQHLPPNKVRRRTSPHQEGTSKFSLNTAWLWSARFNRSCASERWLRCSTDHPARSAGSCVATVVPMATPSFRSIADAQPGGAKDANRSKTESNIHRLWAGFPSISINLIAQGQRYHTGYSCQGQADDCPQKPQPIPHPLHQPRLKRSPQTAHSNPTTDSRAPRSQL
jgi:hypothetical protein